jgi:hypothetical protein
VSEGEALPYKQVLRSRAFPTKRLPGQAEPIFKAAKNLGPKEETGMKRFI